MPEFRRLRVLALLCLASFALAQNPQPYENAAARVLGPNWQKIVHDSGMIFRGAVLETHFPHAGDMATIPIVEVKLRVERAIAGVQPSQVVTIREWAGAWPQHPLYPGQRVLLFLYPPSRLGLTSPVAGPLGQIVVRGGDLLVQPAVSASGAPIRITQLERAVLSVRGIWPGPLPRRHADGREE